MFVKARFAVRAYKLYSRAWDWWQTVLKAWRNRNVSTVVNGVPVKSPIYSAINWSAIGVILVSAMDLIGKTLSAPDAQSIIESLTNANSLPSLLSAVLGIVIILFRTFKNNTVNPSSVQKPGGN